MAHSSTKLPAATASLLEFLALQMEHFDPARKDAIIACTLSYFWVWFTSFGKAVLGSFRILLEKGVLPTLEPILLCPALDPMLRNRYASSYSSSWSMLYVC